MSTSALLSLSQRLTSTSSLLLERSRVISLKLPPSASSQNQIVRNLTAIKNELAKLEDEYALEVGGLALGGSNTPRKGGKGREGGIARELREAGESFDRLVEIFGEDEVGREKAKVLRREPKQSAAQSTNPITPEPVSVSTLTSSNNPSRPGSTVPRVEIEPPTPAANPNMPFRDYPDGPRSSQPYPHAYAYVEDEEDERDDREIMDSQEMAIQDQDDRLNLLSHSIGRQNHLSLQIGSELDQHHELLEDVDGAMDRTAANLGGARRRLDKVAKDAKQYGSTITIVALIVILLLLIIVFKT